MKMYNAKYKEIYLELKTSDNYRINFRWMFSKSFEFEQRFSRDLFDFSADQLREFFLSRNFSKNTTAIFLSMIEDYVNWGISTNRTISKDSQFDKIDKESFIEDISKHQAKFLSNKQVEEISGAKIYGYKYAPLRNKQDQLMVYLAFLGVTGKGNHYLLNLKMSDVNEEELYIKVEDGSRKIHLNPFAINLIKEAHQERIYWKYMGENSNFRGHEYSELVESDYVFKKANSGGNPETPMGNGSLRKRLDAIRDHIGLEMSFNSLERSGMIFLAKVIYDRDGYLNAKNLKDLFDKYRVKDDMQSRSKQLQFVRREIPKVYKEYENENLGR
ncbi:archaellin [Virgibacillus halotolerans]|nr:archaellin [Virgibacillus halotolerans]